jgi:hypothetical protein
LEDLCIDGRVILQWILKKYDCRLWAGMIWHKIRNRAVVNMVVNKFYTFCTVLCGKLLKIRPTKCTSTWNLSKPSRARQK